MKNALLSILEKCEIMYGSNIISKETIINHYWNFLAKTSEDNTRTSISFRTSSICFDAIAIISSILGAFTYTSMSNDDIIASLEINEMILYKGQRYRWKGISTTDDRQMMVMEQDGKGKNGLSTIWTPYEQNKQFVRPYNGSSKVTDGRGIKRKNTNREEFLSYILNIPVSEVPSVIDVSCVIVSKKQRIYEIIKNLRIKYKNHMVSLFDIFPAAYYTGNGSESSLGHNPSKAEPVIRFTEQLSVARDMILEKGSSTIGLLVLNSKYVVDDSSELDDLIGRSKPQFIHISIEIGSDAEERILQQHPEMALFACTQQNLKPIDCNVVEKNELTLELGRQMSIIKNPNIIITSFQNDWTPETYLTIQNKLNIIRKSMLPDDFKENYVISILALMKLFTTAVFPLSWLEMSIKNGKIMDSVKSPSQRIQELQTYINNPKTGDYQNIFIEILDLMVKQYNSIINNNKKFRWLQSYLQQHTSEKILIVVPKAYYINILKQMFNIDDENIVCTTQNRFNSELSFDTIISLCWSSRTFDPLRNYSANNIYLLVYSYEEKMLSYRQKRIEKIDRRLSGETVTDLDIYPEATPITPEIQTEEEIFSRYIDLEQFIDKMNTLQFQHFIKGSQSQGTSPLAEIHYTGQFINGDHICFSKQYVAVVYSPERSQTSEKPVKDLVPGEILVFTRRDEFTRNIVDIIFDRLLESGKLSQYVAEAKLKSLHWKKALKKYKFENGLKHRDIAKKLRDLGSNIEASSVRQWLADESHIVGPREEKMLIAIANLTQDEQLLSDTGLYFDACKTIRSTRRQILKMISSAINDKLSGNLPPEGSDLQIVYQNVDRLAETMELEYVSEVDKPFMLQIGFANRPISDEEVTQ